MIYYDLKDVNYTEQKLANVENITLTNSPKSKD